MTQLDTNQLPKHIAIIMDGNGRWAKKRFLPRFVGHQKGLNSLKKVVTYCSDHGIESLTLFAFSTENWKRPSDEVSKLMDLFLVALQRDVKKLHDKNVQLKIVGDLGAFSQAIRDYIAKSEALTANNTGLKLNIAANYGGRWDVVQAVQAWQQANPDMAVSELTQEAISGYTQLAEQAEPDLLIRTGGEQRISNFLIWQAAYAELYFTDELWPDMDGQSIERAIVSFQKRERRFGKTSEQITQS